MSKKNEKVGMIKKIIIILAILISILVAVLCIVYFSDNNLAKMHITKINSLDKDYSDYIMPLNRNKMVNEYRGNMSEETMYTLIYEFALDVLPQFRNTLNEDIDKFYNDNKDYIYVKTGMENIEEYKAFVEKISKIIHDEVKDRDVNFVTITDARITNDLSYLATTPRFGVIVVK